MHPERALNPAGKRPKVKDRELDALIKAAWDVGWKCSKTHDGHVMCYPPDKTKKPVCVAGTPSDHRVLANTKSQLRNSGLNV